MSTTDKVEIYRHGNQLIAHGATWAFKPGVTKQDYQDAYEKNAIHADRDFAANPPAVVESALSYPDLIEELANRERVSPVDEHGGFHEWFKGDPSFEYYLHIDMSKSRDATGWGMCHYNMKEDKVVVDLIHNDDPTSDWELTFERVYQKIMTLSELGFNIVRVTFDTWQSYMMVERLVNAGYDAGHYSVDRGTEAYDTLIEQLISKRLDYYYQARFISEMKELKLYEGKKYDHPVAGSKDTADGVAGCVAQCVKARVGLSLSNAEIQRATLEEEPWPVEKIWDDVSRQNFCWYEWPEDIKNLPAEERRRPRVIRIDTVEDKLITVMGWHDKDHDVLLAEQYLVWDGFDNSNALALLCSFIRIATQVFTIKAVTLNQFVPLEILSYLQQLGVQISSPLQSRAGGNRRRSLTPKTAALSKQAFRITVAQVKQGNILFPADGRLLRDLKYTTEDNLQNRTYVSALAGWVDFMTRFSGFGPQARAMPTPVVATGVKPMGAQAAAIGKGIRQPTAVRNTSGDRSVDSIRARYATTLNKIKAQGKKQAGEKSLPSPIKGPSRKK